MGTDQKAIDEAMLAIKEQVRQFHRFAEENGDAAIEEMLKDSPQMKRIVDLLAGKISIEEAEAENQRDSDAFATLAREMDDPAGVTASDANNEALAKGLPLAAQLLISDAVSRAASGLSKEEWIAEVLKGHAADEEAQLGCLRHIVTLWTDGPWAWPRSAATENAAGASA